MFQWAECVSVRPRCCVVITRLHQPEEALETSKVNVSARVKKTQTKPRCPCYTASVLKADITGREDVRSTSSACSSGIFYPVGPRVFCSKWTRTIDWLKLNQLTAAAALSAKNTA